MSLQKRNVLVTLIHAGKIRTLQDLKSAYHKLVMKTHPDAVGSGRHLESYLELSSHYREARAYLSMAENGQSDSFINDTINHRLGFFQQLHLIESLEMPYSYHKDENREKLDLAKKTAMDELLGWRKDLVELYRCADKEYVGIKNLRPMGPYLTHALALNVRPLMHNLIEYHLTGRDLYAQQARQNISGIMHRLTVKGCVALREFLSILLEDMKDGAAVLG